jgi:dTDP-4-dehydrorhamnose reductase
MILVTGASGFVGKKIMQMCKDAIPCPSLRNASEKEICRLVDESGADTIVHTAAISDIGVCQEDPQASYLANVQLPLHLAKAAKGRKLICFSSDQVYSALEEDGPYGEDRVKAEHVYGKHKIEMEERVLDIVPDAVMLRAEWMYDYYLEKPNYFMNMIRAEGTVSFSSRQYRGVTYVKEVAQNMEKVIMLPGGAYNFGSETEKSMYELTKDFLKLLGKNVQVEDSLPRHNLWMNCQKARKFGITFQSVEEALKTCAKDYGFLE